MKQENQAQKMIGRCIRILREKKKLTLEALSHSSGITYQYLSDIENGKVNFTISILAAISVALAIPLKAIVDLAYEDPGLLKSLKVNAAHFRPEVPLPEGLTIDNLEASLNQTQLIFHHLNQTLLLEVKKPLSNFIQRHNFSGLVSNIISDSINDNTPFKHNHHQKYPDLVNTNANDGKGEGLEVKATIKVGKGGESHNGHGGWHMVCCFELQKETGDIQFVHVMFANLNGHKHPETDWKYVGSSVDEVTGSQRTETYVTTREGTTKLRDGSVFLDPNKVNFSRWKQGRKPGQLAPSWSIFGN
jgi:transcriptional regulator with XRE-family HTH domain